MKTWVRIAAQREVERGIEEASTAIERVLVCPAFWSAIYIAWRNRADRRARTTSIDE